MNITDNNIHGLSIVILEAQHRDMVLNVIEPAQTGYIALAEDLEEFLKEKFGKEHPDFDYDIHV
jgi:hypothetical protein